MALDSYSNLKAAVIDWSHRNDIADKLDDFIAVAEQSMFSNPLMPLQLRQMETRATATLTAGEMFLALPDGYLDMRRLKISLASGDYEVVFKAPAEIETSNIAGIPAYFTVTSQVEFDRPASDDYSVEMQYFAKPTGLSSSNTTNTILASHSTAYLYGTLWAVFVWSGDDIKEQQYLSRFLGAIEGINKEYTRGRFGPAPVMRMKGSFP